ncbi:oxidoreductase [Paenibacillus thailandensis]|uniref:Oxidoreductase n=1 Tax=Paenibacillus thailandensis TaxID=393250 RepID=A0ABW5QTN5_9BACL
MKEHAEPLRPFRALLLEKEENGGVRAAYREVTESELPPGDVLVKVAYSGINYKDAMALQRTPLIVRSFPMVPGIDFSGTVVRSDSAAWKEGDRVIMTGWGAGERKWGGYAEYARMPAEQLVPLPAGMSLRHAMTIGTAGLTAMLCVMALERQGVKPDSGEVAVTGATGGVGSFAVTLLAAAGYSVTAVTGKAEQADYLRSLGAASVIGREELNALSSKPLHSERWAGAVDTVGGQPLAALLGSTRYGGAVAACGMASSSTFQASVYPFILRNVALVGVESVIVPTDRRLEAWNRLNETLAAEQLDRITNDITLGEVMAQASAMLEGASLGRTVVAVGGS